MDEIAFRTVVIRAGNGGGLCAVRHLRNRGVEVRVVRDRLSGGLSGPAARYDRLDVPTFGFGGYVVALGNVTSG